jgi:tetratricopeptide (TPR) repeat protein
MKPLVVRIVLIVNLLLSISSLVSAQQYSDKSFAPNKTDLQKISKAEPALQSRLWNELANHYLNNAPDSAFKYARKAQKSALQFSQNNELAMSYLILGNVFYNQGIFNQAIEEFIKAMRYFKQAGNEKGLAEIYQDLGLAYHYSKKPEVALENYKKSLDIFQKIKDEKGIAGTLSYIGHIFEKKADYHTALDHQQKALDIYQKINDKAGIAKVMDDIGSIYEDWKDYGKAEQYFSTALRYNLEINNQVAAIIDLNNIGDIHQKQGSYKVSLQYTFQCLALARKLNQKYQIRGAYRDLAQTHFYMKEYEKGYLYLDSAYRVYGEVYNSETARQIAHIQTLYEMQEKDKEIAILENSRLFNTRLNYIFIAGFILLLAFAGLIFNRQRLVILKNKKIIQQNELIYSTQNELQESALENMRLNEQKLKTELENKQLREQTLQNELMTRNRELTGRALHIIQKNEMLTELRQKIELALRKKDTDKTKELKELAVMIDYSFHLDKDWEEFKLAFEQVHGDFFTKLQALFPDLTSGDIRLCALLRLNLSSKDTAAIMGISQDSLRVNRHRLRKKMNIEQGDNLVNFMMGL